MWCTSTSEWTSTNKESRIGAERKSEFWTHPFAYPKNGYPNFLWLTLNHRTILQKNRGLHAIYQHRYEWTIINGSGRRKETRTLDSPFRFNRNVCQIFSFWPKSLDYPPKNRVDIFSFAFSEMRTLLATFIRNRKEILFCLSFWNLLTNRERNVGTKPVYSPRRSYSWCRCTKHRIFPASCPFEETHDRWWRIKLDFHRFIRKLLVVHGTILLPRFLFAFWRNESWWSSFHNHDEKWKPLGFCGINSVHWTYPPTIDCFLYLRDRLHIHEESFRKRFAFFSFLCLSVPSFTFFTIKEEAKRKIIKLYSNQSGNLFPLFLF